MAGVSRNAALGRAAARAGKPGDSRRAPRGLPPL